MFSHVLNKCTLPITNDVLYHSFMKFLIFKLSVNQCLEKWSHNTIILKSLQNLFCINFLLVQQMKNVESIGLCDGI